MCASVCLFWFVVSRKIDRDDVEPEAGGPEESVEIKKKGDKGKRSLLTYSTET